ncbi:MAG: hypothetical protein ABNG97_09725 [Sulfitobacter sp.]|jgi:hypothetical protein
MTNLLDRIKADFEGKKMRKVAVPEWNTDIFFNPLTLSERKRIGKGHAKDDDAGLMVSLLIEKALDKDGKPIFESDALTRATLEGGADAGVVSRVVTAMGAQESQDEAKNA